MLALRLIRVARPGVQLRRLTVATASAGTGFLLLSSLGYALGHPEHSAAAALRLSWCVLPLAATVYLAIAVARTDPGTRPRPGLSALGLGPGRLMAVSAATTALACGLGSLLALLLFMYLRGDGTELPFDGAAPAFLAPGEPLPVPAVLTLLTVVPVLASVAVALVLCPRESRPTAARNTGRKYGRFGAYRRTGTRETFGAYGRFGSRLGDGTAGRQSRSATQGRSATACAIRPQDTADGTARTEDDPTRADMGADPTGDDLSRHDLTRADLSGADPTGDNPSRHDLTRTDLSGADPTGDNPSGVPEDAGHEPAHDDPDPHRPPAPRQPPTGLPWGIAVLAAGLTVEAYAGRSTPPGTAPGPALPVGLAAGSAPVLIGWLMTALGLALAGPGLTHLCGRVLQSARPGALRLLAGRVLMEEAGRVGRPLGVVCAVASGTYAMIAAYDGTARALGPLTTLGTLLVAGCAVATLLIAAVEARQSRADAIAALLRLGAPAAMLRSAALLRCGALLALFIPLTLAVADLAALPLVP
ncbi:hypothetical protein ACFCYB_28880 [Streptomyces sp. NPDC056309]|uniref:hypothetical protein n=1 Tax=unclassified Streptomyces TaxID=2593676 RepID=UPI0035E387C2